jgi:hypothetical protein
MPNFTMRLRPAAHAGLEFAEVEQVVRFHNRLSPNKTAAKLSRAGVCFKNQFRWLER